MVIKATILATECAAFLCQQSDHCRQKWSQPYSVVTIGSYSAALIVLTITLLVNKSTRKDLRICWVILFAFAAVAANVDSMGKLFAALYFPVIVLQVLIIDLMNIEKYSFYNVIQLKNQIFHIIHM